MQESQGVLQNFEPIPILSDFGYIPSDFSSSKSVWKCYAQYYYAK